MSFFRKIFQVFTKPAQQPEHVIVILKFFYDQKIFHENLNFRKCQRMLQNNNNRSHLRLPLILRWELDMQK